MILDQTIAPHTVIELTAENQFLIDRVSKLPESLIVGTHYTPEGMKRRIDAYRVTNRKGTGNTNIKTF